MHVYPQPNITVSLKDDSARNALRPKELVPVSSSFLRLYMSLFPSIILNLFETQTITVVSKNETNAGHKSPDIESEDKCADIQDLLEAELGNELIKVSC